MFSDVQKISRPAIWITPAAGLRLSSMKRTMISGIPPAAAEFLIAFVAFASRQHGGFPHECKDK